MFTVKSEGDGEAKIVDGIHQAYTVAAGMRTFLVSRSHNNGSCTVEQTDHPFCPPNKCGLSRQVVSHSRSILIEKGQRKPREWSLKMWSPVAGSYKRTPKLVSLDNKETV